MATRRFGDCAPAFTLVELLVVIAVIGALVALLLPAIQSTRAAARQVACQNNLHQIGLALLAYHAVHEEFPTGCIEWRPLKGTTERQLAWSATILPQLDEQPLADQIDFALPFDHPANAVAAATVVATYICPASERGRQLAAGRGPCDYGGIFGERITGPNQPPKGTMLIDQSVSLKDIADGATHTLLVGEDSGFADGQWINGRNLFDQAFAIGAAPAFENDLRSEHAGGAMGITADGAVRWLPEETTLQVLAALCTRAGGEVGYVP